MRDTRAKRLTSTVFALIIPAAACLTTWAASPWPAESNTAAVKLTSVDPEFNAVNMSGAAWNPVTRTLWLANNSGRFSALVEDGAGSFRVPTNASGVKAKWYPGGDLESIGQADFTQAIVYLMDEDGWIRECDVSNYGVVAQNRSWDIRAQCPEVNGSGPEAITFVPDEWLRRQGFRDGNGALYTSTNGMSGLMFVGHQSGGYVHVFDLNRANRSYGYVGRYKTGRTETAGLEFDRSTGKLWVWHNIGVNYLEVTELNSYVDGSDRRLRPIIEYVGPRSGNLEGFAMTPTPDTNSWCFITDDNNANGEAIVWYRRFEPSEDADADSLPDGWELWHFGSLSVTTGAADTDSDKMSNADEYAAGTDPTNALSVLAIVDMATDSGNARAVIRWHSATGRLYEVWSTTNLAGGFTQVLDSAITATPPLNTLTSSAPAAAAFYRVGVDSP
jgi:hypothetical protein